MTVLYPGKLRYDLGERVTVGPRRSWRPEIPVSRPVGPVEIDAAPGRDTGTARLNEYRDLRPICLIYLTPSGRAPYSAS